MSATRPPKKTETLEIRLDHATKDAFMARCRAEGRTASEALRDFIDGRGLRPAKRRHGLGWTVVAALGAGLAVGAIAAPSLAQSASRAVHAADDRAAFARIDRNGDGVVSLAEFEAR